MYLNKLNHSRHSPSSCSIRTEAFGRLGVAIERHSACGPIGTDTNPGNVTVRTQQAKASATHRQPLVTHREWREWREWPPLGGGHLTNVARLSFRQCHGLVATVSAGRLGVVAGASVARLVGWRVGSGGSGEMASTQMAPKFGPRLQTKVCVELSMYFEQTQPLTPLTDHSSIRT